MPTWLSQAPQAQEELQAAKAVAEAEARRAATIERQYLYQQEASVQMINQMQAQQMWNLELEARLAASQAQVQALQSAGCEDAAAWPEASCSAGGGLPDARAAAWHGSGDAQAPAAYGSADDSNSSPLYAGIVGGLPDVEDGDVATVRCPEARVVFGCGEVKVPSPLLPADSKVGDCLCFQLRGGQEAPEVVPGTVARLGSIQASSQALAGTLQAFTRKPTGEKVAWVASQSTHRLFGADVYVHGSMAKDLCRGDVIRFVVRLNDKQKPQAANGTVALIARDETAGDSPIRPMGRPVRPDVLESMDATVHAPGRVVALPVCEEADDEAWQ